LGTLFYCVLLTSFMSQSGPVVQHKSNQTNDKCNVRSIIEFVLFIMVKFFKHHSNLFL